MISSFCKTDEGMCIDVSRSPHGGLEIRNTDNLIRWIHVTKAEFEAFVLGVKAGEFDDLWDAHQQS